MFGPDGAEGCSHGWSSPRANGTRGLVTTRPSRPGGAEDGSPSPLRGEPIEAIPFHGFCVPLRGTRHPWLQPWTPSGSTAPNDRASFEQAPNIGGFLQSIPDPFNPPLSSPQTHVMSHEEQTTEHDGPHQR